MTRLLSLLALFAGALTASGAVAQDTVRIVLKEEPRTLDPCQSVSADVGKVVSQNITESLTQINPTDGSVAPRLSSEWTQVDPTTWRFILREGVKFHDGSDFDAADVVFTFERMTKEALTCFTYSKMFGTVEVAATAVDPRTVEFKLDHPSPIFPTLVGTVQIVPEGAPSDQSWRAPIGTGPFKLVEWQTGEQITVERNPDYWGEQPAVAGATYVWRSESALRAAMVATGEADIADSISVQDASDPETDFAYLNSETTRMRIDAMTPPLDDVRVRKALNLAIDREGLKALLGDDVLLATQYVVPGIFGHNDDLVPYGYDPDEARALLEAARADGVPVDTQVTVIAREGQYSNSTEVVQAMRAMWQAVGFNIDLKVLDLNAWYEYLAKPFPPDRGAILFDQQHDNNNGDASFTAFYNYAPDGPGSAISDAALGELIAKAESAEGDERKALFNEVFRRIHDDIVADVFMFHMVGYNRVSPRLDWQPNISANSQIELATIAFRD